MIQSSNNEITEVRKTLLSSLLSFTKVFFKLSTGKDFIVSQPIARLSHHILIANALEQVFLGRINKLAINIPPRYGKTELIIAFIAWSLAHYPDSEFIYLSYGADLAIRSSARVRDIVNLPHYKKTFGVRLRDDSQARNHFTTSAGGVVYATGAGGVVTGMGAGKRGVNRFGGALIMDDLHKPDEVSSDTVRRGIIDWYTNTASSRLNNGVRTPQICIGQRLHEEDLPSVLIADGWTPLILPALDSSNNALDPAMHTKEELLEMRAKQPYFFAAQMQQNPQPAGGGLFKEDWFVLHHTEPDILATFITCDTAETDKDYNDATVFSFWGIYKIVQFGRVTDEIGLHLIDCIEIRVEPADLEHEFIQFYTRCMGYKVKPREIGIEKKSTGVTLVSALKRVQGIHMIDIERTKASGSKTTRFIELQSYIKSGYVSLPLNGVHTNMFIKHMSKITANDSHAHDDIADTCYDAVKLALIDKVIIYKYVDNDVSTQTMVSKDLARQFATIKRLRHNQYDY